MIKGKWICLPFLFAAMLLFAGCATQNYEVVVSPAGTVDFAIELAVNAEDYQKLVSYNIDLQNRLKQDAGSASPLKRVNVLFQEIGAVYSEQGFTVAPVEDAANVGMRAQKKYESVRAFVEDCEKLQKLGICGLKPSITKDQTLFRDVYTFDGQLVYLEDPDVSKMSPENRKMLEGLIRPEKLRAKVAVTMPGDLIALPHGQPHSSGGSVELVYGTEKSTPVRLRTSVLNTPMVTLAGLLGAVIVGGLSVVAARKMRIRRAEKKEKEFYAA